MKYKINRQKCTGCRVCIQTCPGATKIRADGKAEIIDQEKLKKCGREGVCPFGAIEKIEGEEESETEIPPYQNQIPSFGGRGMGRGIGAGRGRGFGTGPRDGRGRGCSGGGRGGGRKNW